MALLTPQELQRHLDEAVKRLRAALSPTAVYFLGPYVYGSPGPDSDLDLLVVVDSSPDSPFERDAAAYRSLGDLPIPIDGQVYTRDEFERRAALPVSFERTVKTKGKLLYVA